MFQEFPKWVYRTDGPQESYKPGTEPVLVQDADKEATVLATVPAVDAAPKRKAKD